MISKDTYLRPVWIALFVQSVIWSFSDSLPEKAAQLAPWDWDDDDDWFRRRTTRSIWNRYTDPPDTFGKSKSSSGPDPIIWVIIGAVILISLLAMLIRYVCAHKDDEDSYDSRPVLHPPPAVIVPPPERNYQTTTVPPPPHHSRNSTPVTLGGGIYNHRAPMEAPTYGTGDMPPGYSEVVMADFVEEMKKFPEVARKPLDTPPPNYEDGNLPKY